MSGDHTARILAAELHTRDGMTIVTVHGEVDTASVPELQIVLDQAQHTGIPVVVDMSDVGFMGSAGLSALLVAAQAAEPRRLRVVVSPAVRRPIEVTGLDATLSVHDTVDAALAADPES